MKKTLRAIFLVVLSVGLAACSRGGFISQHGSDLNNTTAVTEKKEKTKPTVRTASLSRNAARQSASYKKKPRKQRRNAKLIGGISSSEISSFLNDADRQAAARAEYRALEFGNPGVATPWRNPNNGKYGNVVASKPFKQMNIHCRQYTHTIYINGRPEITRKTACRNKDGSWQDLG